MGKGSTLNSAFASPRALFALLLCVAACLIVTETLLAFWRSEASANVSQRTLTFAERVAYQRAIEDVYWRHRIWPRNRGERPDPKPSLDAVMSQAQLEKKVADYLRKSKALEDYWQRPITAEQLQAEMDRMAQHTRQPDVLQEIFEALGNDPFVIAECLARPALAERLLTSWYAYDERIHGELKQRAEAEFRSHPAVEQMKQILPGAAWHSDAGAVSEKYNEIELVKSESGESVEQAVVAATLPNEQLAGEAPALQRQDAIHSLKLNSREWDETVERLTAAFKVRRSRLVGTFKSSPRDESVRPADADMPAHSKNSAAEDYESLPVGKVSLLQEEETRLYATAILSKGNDRLKLATVSWLKESFESWLAKAENQMPNGIRAPAGSYTLPKISEGGGCIDDTWTATAGAPAARAYHTAIWTGSEMIVWGGNDQNSNGLDTGGRYSPATDSWIFTATTNAPQARASSYSSLDRQRNDCLGRKCWGQHL